MKKTKSIKDKSLPVRKHQNKSERKWRQESKNWKPKKEAKRQEDVNSKLDKRFVQNADELRKVDQDLKELKTAY